MTARVEIFRPSAHGGGTWEAVGTEEAAHDEALALSTTYRILADADWLEVSPVA